MKIKLFLTSLVVGLCAVLVLSCSKDDEYEDFYSLDINSHTPATRSSMNDWQETGASQTYGGPTQDIYYVPQHEDECMMYAIISIAKDNQKVISFKDKNGKIIKKRIGQNLGNNKVFSATVAYETVKGMATSQMWPVCDDSGKPIEGGGEHEYTKGAMEPTIAVAIGKESGILSGVIQYFDSFDELQDYIEKTSFQQKHKKGTYIICSKKGRHATIGYGIRKGEIQYKDAKHQNRTAYDNEEKEGKWSLIY